MNIESVGIFTCLLGFGYLLYGMIASTRNKIMRLLDNYDIPYSTWDADGSTRTLDRLIESVRMGEIDIEPGDDGKLMLFVHVAVVTIRHRHSGKWFELREYRRNNQEELVLRPFSGSLGGKIRMKLGESPMQAAQREIVEELGSTKSGFRDTKQYALGKRGLEIIGPQPSDGRPGLYDVYNRYHFHCVIPNDLYSHTYTEHHPGKEERHFFWVRI